MQGRTFEDEVASLLLLMGYEVRTNEVVAGHEIDILATQQNLLVPTRYVVECKSGGERVSANAVLETRQKLSAISQTGEPAGAIIVAKSGFSSHAKEIAEQSKIRCITISELRSEAFDIGRYLSHLIGKFEKAGLPSTYIDLSLQEPGSGSTPATTASQYLVRWTLNENANLLLILGDFGCGKTTLCQKYVYDAAKNYQSGTKDARIPVLLSSRDFDGKASLQELVLSVLHRNASKLPSSRMLDHLSEQGVFVLVLDGIDELNPSDLPRLLDEVMRIADSRRSKILITARRYFYESEMKGILHRLPNLEVVTLGEMNSSQVQDFLAKFSVRSPKASTEGTAFVERILSSRQPGLLPKQPLFLRFMAEWSGQTPSIENVTIPKLYEGFIIKLLEQTKIESQKVGIPMQMRAMSEIATRMHKRQDYSISPTDPELLSLDPSGNWLKSLSLFLRDAQGNYSFSHRSFCDFFVSRKLAHEIQAGDLSELSDVLVSREILQFLADYELPIDVLNKRATAFKPNVAHPKILAENIQNLRRLYKVKSAERIPRLRLSKLRLTQIKCFSDIEFDFRSDPETGSLMLFVGDNGIGKSTLLQSVALCALGPDLASKLVSRPDNYLRDGAEEGFMRATFKIAGLDGRDQSETVICLRVSRDNRRFELVTSGEHASQNSREFLDARSRIGFSGLFVAGYGPWRHFDLTDDPTGALKEDPLIDRVCSLFDSRKLLFSPRSLSRLLVGDGNPFSELGAPASLSTATRNRIIKLIDSLLPEKSETNRITEDGFYSSPFGKAPLAELSEGYRSTLAWVGHLIVHILSVIEWSDDLDEVSGLVLFDELDLHLHPKWQRIIVSKIRQTFPNLQFISTTHSPLVLADVDTKKGEAVLLKREGNEVRAQTDLPSVRGLRADQILASELFDYIIDRDPTTERVLREVSILAGKKNRTPTEEANYAEVLDQLKEILVPEGQTFGERQAISARSRQISQRIRQLESKLFGGRT
jgi:GTPase SAR1 family protein